MMNGRTLWRVIAFAVLAVAIGAAGYQLGVTHGLAESGQLMNPDHAYVHGWYPWGHGFFFFPFPFLFLLILVFALKGAFWGRHRHWGYRYDGVPPAFEEWHRRAHGQPPTAPTTSDPSSVR